MKRTAAFTFMLAAAIWFPATATAATCESLAALALPNTAITMAQTVAAGEFSVPGARAGRGNAMTDLPAFCRVAATLTPTSDSDIKIEVWLPAQNWNSKFQAVGNGAWTGAIGYAAMADALRRGYATSSTDTGHVGGSASFALGHPEKLVDFAYRSEHEMTVKAKAIVNAFYGSAPKYSYWNGCSAGGRQALKEAQMFPADFDGIIAGSPGLDWSGRSAQAVRVAQALIKEDARLTPAKAQVLHAAAVQACDTLDGLKDGLIDNPAACTFDPKVVECKAGDGEGCLTSAQVATARFIYAPYVNPKTKRVLAGLAPGSELGWTDQGWSVSARATGLDHYRFVVFKDPAWDIDRFNADADVARIDAGANPLTFAGLAGMGDLIATCGSSLSRNHQLGVELARGRSWTELETALPGTAEGAYTVDAALALADRLGVEMPIAREVHRALFEGKSVKRCLVDLLARESKDELVDARAWLAAQRGR